MTYRVVQEVPCGLSSLCVKPPPARLDGRVRCDGCNGDGTRMVEVPFPESGRLLVSENRTVEMEPLDYGVTWIEVEP